MTVKNEEVFSKVIPMFMSLEKMFEVDTIKEIFEYCRKKKNSAYNFSAISRIKLLTNIVFNARQNRLDLPIRKFMEDTYDFVAVYPKCHKRDVYEFIHKFCNKYAMDESSDQVKILMSKITMEHLEEQFTKMFKCLVNVSRPDKKGNVKLNKAELLWDKKSDAVYNPNSVLDNTMLEDFLNMMKEPIVLPADDTPIDDGTNEEPQTNAITIQNIDEEEEEEEEIWIPECADDVWLGDYPF